MIESNVHNIKGFAVIDVIYVQFEGHDPKPLSILEAVSLKIEIEKRLADPVKDITFEQFIGLKDVLVDLVDKINKAQGPIADILRGNSNSNKYMKHESTEEVPDGSGS